MSPKDYTPELAEIARGSESGCAVFDWDKLTEKQRYAIQSIVWMNWKMQWGDVQYKNFTIRYIVHETAWKMVTVLENRVAIPEKDIY
jgi:hypothetical protein